MSNILTKLGFSGIGSIGLLITTCISYRIWIGNEVVPRFPIFESLDVSDTISSIHFALLITTCTAALFLKSIWPKRLCLALMLLSFVLDWNKMQPYNIVFCVLIFLDLNKKHDHYQLLRIFLIGIYFYSGIHKLNLFYTSEIDSLLFDFPFDSLKPLFHQILLYIPFLEILIALGLVLNLSFKYALTAAVTLHVGVIVFLLLINYNIVVLPWNVVMIGCLLLAKLNPPTNLFSKTFTGWGMIILFWIFPFVNIITPYFAYSSWNVYSNRIPYGELYIDNRDVELLPEQFKNHLDISPHFTKVDLIKLSISATNVAINPEPWIYKRWLKTMCNDQHQFKKYLYLHLYTFKSKTQEVYSCNP